MGYDNAIKYLSIFVPTLTKCSIAMSKLRIDFIILDEYSINIQQNSTESYFIIGDYHAIIPPHCMTSKHFSGSDVMTAFINVVGGVGINLISNYLYDLIKNKKITRLKINGKNVSTKQDISKALDENEDDD